MDKGRIELTPAQKQEFDRWYLQLRRDVVRGMDINDARRSLRAILASMAEQEGDGSEAGDN